MRADPGAASPERMFSMLTTVEASVSSTSRCRKWRLLEGTLEERRPGHRDLCAFVAGGDFGGARGEHIYPEGSVAGGGSQATPGCRNI